MANAETRRLLLGGGVYDCRPEETVLDALLRQGLAVPNSCRRQICMTCMMRALNGSPPAESQTNLPDSLKARNFFLACNCRPERNMEITFTAETVGEAAPAKVDELNALCPFILE
ncbi:MAG: 2Fe-2S iron-sulfur cluster binding domain-containing protein, partial [Methylocella sp.]